MSLPGQGQNGPGNCRRPGSQGARGNVAVRGVRLKSTGTLVELAPNPKAVRAPHFYPAGLERNAALIAHRSSR